MNINKFFLSSLGGLPNISSINTAGVFQGNIHRRGCITIKIRKIRGRNSDTTSGIFHHLSRRNRKTTTYF